MLVLFIGYSFVKVIVINRVSDNIVKDPTVVPGGQKVYLRLEAGELDDSSSITKSNVIMFLKTLGLLVLAFKDLFLNLWKTLSDNISSQFAFKRLLKAPEEVQIKFSKLRRVTYKTFQNHMGDRILLDDQKKSTNIYDI